MSGITKVILLITTLLYVDYATTADSTCTKPPAFISNILQCNLMTEDEIELLHEILSCHPANRIYGRISGSQGRIYSILSNFVHDPDAYRIYLERNGLYKLWLLLHTKMRLLVVIDDEDIIFRGLYWLQLGTLKYIEISEDNMAYIQKIIPNENQLQKTSEKDTIFICILNNTSANILNKEESSRIYDYINSFSLTPAPMEGMNPKFRRKFYTVCDWMKSNRMTKVFISHNKDVYIPYCYFRKDNFIRFNLLNTNSRKVDTIDAPQNVMLEIKKMFSNFDFKPN